MLVTLSTFLEIPLSRGFITGVVSARVQVRIIGRTGKFPAAVPLAVLLEVPVSVTARITWLGSIFKISTKVNSSIQFSCITLYLFLIVVK